MAFFTTSTQLIITALFIQIGIFAQGDFEYPFTKKDTIQDDYFGQKITDEYRWLEDDRSVKTEAWVKAQNSVTANYLSKIEVAESLKKRLTELWNYNKQSAPFQKGNLFFCYKNTGLQNQSVLYVAKSFDAAPDDWTVLLDPNTLSDKGTVSLNSISIAKDCKTLAYSVSEAGSDWQEIRFRNIITKKDLPDVIKWVKFSGISWKGDGIYYSRYDEPTQSALSQKNTGHKVYYHKLGLPQAKDELIYKDDKNPNHNFSAQVTEDEQYLIVYESASTSGEKPMIKDLKNPNAAFVNIQDNFKNDFSIIGNVKDTFYVLTNKNASNYELTSFVFANAIITNYKVVIPQSDNRLANATLSDNKIIVTYLQNASSTMYAYTYGGQLIKQIKLPGICKINALNANNNSTFASYSIAQYIAPEQVFVLNTKTFESKLLFKPNSSFDSENYITKQLFYTSKDGTKIPMFVTHKKGLAISPETPCFVYGYGGFNISLGPEFRIDRALFLEAGGIYCVPNLRGGGEFGEKWHKAGTKCNKQNVFDDFISACDYLVESKMTSYNKIAIHGRSNGGLLIGAVITQRPDICRVALPTVGVLDMLRFHLFTIGRAWTTDYGCSNMKEEFECLIKYSPLHNIDATNYPATLILTGDHDDRVVPAHSFKFAAKLQEKNQSKYPILIRIDVDAGHGSGKPTAKQIDEFADMWAFTFYELGMKH